MTHEVAPARPRSKSDGLAPSSGVLFVDRAVLALTAFLPTYLAAATLIAIFGLYRPAVLIFVAVIPAAGLSWMVASRHTTGVLRMPPAAPTAVALSVVFAMAALNIAYSAEHLLTDRDPGVYLNTARWLALHGNLLVEGVTGPFEGISGLTANWTGFYEMRSDGLLYPQFLHMFPSGIAGLKWVFGDRAVRMVNAPVMAIGFGFVYLLAAQVAKPWFAGVATIASSVSVVGWYFARDLYTEPLVLLLLVSAIASMWIGYVSRTMVPVVVAGLALGASAGVRIDSWFLIGGFAIAVAVLFAHRVAAEEHRVSTVVGAMLVPYVFGLVGLFDGSVRSPGYIIGRLSLIRPMLGLSFLAFLFAGGLLVAAAVVGHAKWHRIADSTLWTNTVSRVMRWTVASTVVVGALYLAIVRPTAPAMGARSVRFIAEILERDGLPANGARTLTELSLRWFAWYWGWLGVVVVVVGVVIVLFRAVSRRTVTEIALMIAGGMMIVYLIRPSIFGDQPWAMRRYLVPALILIPLLMATSIDAFWTWGSGVGRRWLIPARISILIGSAVLVVTPIVVSYPIAAVSHQRGMAATTEKLCAALPDNAAVVVAGAPIDTQFGATIRTFCDVPTVASVENLTADLAADIAAILEERGVEPVFVTSVAFLPDGWQLLASDIVSYSIVEATAVRAPDSVELVDFQWYVSSRTR